MNRASTLLLLALISIVSITALAQPFSPLSGNRPLHDAANEEENPQENTPLHLALFHRRYALARTLIEGNADVDLCNNLGTALNDAAFCADLEAVALLLQHGARVDIANSDGNYPIHQIVRRYGGHAEPHHAEIIGLLLRGGSATLMDSRGDNALHVAIANGNLIAVQAILTGASRGDLELIDTLDGQNRNALLGAIEANFDRLVDVERHREIIALLLFHRADLIYQKSKDGLSMVRCAIRALNPYALSALLSHPLSEADSVEELIAYARGIPVTVRGQTSTVLELRQQNILTLLRSKLAPLPALLQAVKKG